MEKISLKKDLTAFSRANITNGYCKISQGGVCGTIVDIKMIAKHALECLSSDVILAHNHPSGGTNPSIQDIYLTKKVKEDFKLLDIKITDQLIFTKDEYYSFSDDVSVLSKSLINNNYTINLL